MDQYFRSRQCTRMTLEELYSRDQQHSYMFPSAGRCVAVGCNRVAHLLGTTSRAGPQVTVIPNWDQYCIYHGSHRDVPTYRSA